MRNGTPSILEFTNRAAAGLAAEHAGDPMGELLVWLHIALRREASVGEIYAPTNLRPRLHEVDSARSVLSLIETTLGNVWAQEKAHAAFLEAALSTVAHQPAALWHRLAARLDGVMGLMEGHLMSGRTSPRPLERVKAGLMLAIGRKVQDVPAFVDTLGSLSFAQFCNLSAELEITAVHGYERMLALLDAIPRSNLVHETTLAIDIGRMARDERWHNDALREMEGWFASDGHTLRAGLSYDLCAARLATIRDCVYAIELGRRPLRQAHTA